MMAFFRNFAFSRMCDMILGVILGLTCAYSSSTDVVVDFQKTKSVYCLYSTAKKRMILTEPKRQALS